MGAPKGHPRWGGRKKGTPNRATKAAKDFRDKLLEHGFDLLDEIRRCLEDITDSKERAKILVQLLPYAYPKLQVVDEGKLIEADLANMTPEELEEEAKLILLHGDGTNPAPKTDLS